MLKNLTKIALMAVTTYAAGASAIPVLQVGAPGAGCPGDCYANYQGSLSDPTESDTATTTGNVIYVAASYEQGNNDPLLIGGRYSTGAVIGADWSAFGFNNAFDGKGAVLMATVPNGTLGGIGNSISILVDSVAQAAFYSTGIYESGFEVPNPPSNHAPIQNQDYLFFDLGNFLSNESVPNFADETRSDPGQIKEITLMIQGFPWVHFDVFALVTDNRCNGQEVCTRLVSNGTEGPEGTGTQGNPGSHDVTWKEGDDEPIPGVPEPATLALLGLGLLGMAVARRRSV